MANTWSLRRNTWVGFDSMEVGSEMEKETLPTSEKEG
jgi:hypothetical protein